MCFIFELIAFFAIGNSYGFISYNNSVDIAGADL